MSRAIENYHDRERPVPHGEDDMTDETKGGPPRILVIDDSPPVCRSLRLTLRGLGEVETIDADPYGACLDGIESVTKNPPAVVVVDGLEGYGRHVVEACQSEGVPVVAYTGSPEVFRGLSLPVVVKPDTGGLLRALRGVLEVGHG